MSKSKKPVQATSLNSTNSNSNLQENYILADELILDDILMSKTRYEPPTKDKILKLSDSIDEIGQLYPILVIPFKSKYKVIAGNTRTQALQELNRQQRTKTDDISQYTLAYIKVLSETDSQKLLLIAITENESRNDLTYMDRACNIRALMDSGKTQGEVADFYQFSQAHISNHLSLHKLPDSLKKELQNKKLGYSDALTLIRICKTPEEMERTYEVAKEKAGLKNPLPSNLTGNNNGKTNNSPVSNSTSNNSSSGNPSPVRPPKLPGTSIRDAINESHNIDKKPKKKIKELEDFFEMFVSPNNPKAIQIFCETTIKFIRNTVSNKDYEDFLWDQIVVL